MKTQPFNKTRQDQRSERQVTDDIHPLVVFAAGDQQVQLFDRMERQGAGDDEQSGDRFNLSYEIGGVDRHCRAVVRYDDAPFLRRPHKQFRIGRFTHADLQCGDGLDTPKGTIITSVQSVSLNGDHVFQVPMFDPHDMPASAGGFPWKADSDFTTIVYIKNETAVPRKFVAHLVYDSGQYSLGIRELGPGETIGIDFRELRDNQSPGSQGNVIPLEINRGQIAWSVLGAEDKVLSGRSEQISFTGGVASTYACANCCPNVIDSVDVNPV